MYFPVTRYGMPQVLIFPLIVLALMAALFIFLPPVPLIIAETFLFLVLVWMLSFFRNPPRKIHLDSRVLLSPADGTITDITEVQTPEIGGKALKIGMFLSVFSVHINRAPCAARIETINYRKGKFINAMDADAGRVNESNDILMTRLDEPLDKLLVRQVSGAIARHIVCEAKPGQQYAQGEAFGMIKFGSRTELYLPLKDAGYDVTVKIGDKVNAGLSPLVVYK